MNVDFRNLPLGKTTAYVDKYNPSLLIAIPRVQTRDFIADSIHLPFYGIDEWNAFEVSWLNVHGRPEVACARLLYSAHSPAIVESKSLKLYLNSLNGSVFANSTELQNIINKDITHCIHADVQCQLLPLDDILLHIAPWGDLCIDYLNIDINDYTPEANLLCCQPDQIHEETLVSHLLRSLCPVTGQPDWASVRIRYRGAKITHDSLLKYICSFRLHQGFHEQCIERIFCDIQTQCQPTLLSIEGRFTRRGGVDINPFRSSEPDAKPTFARQSRQ